MKNILIKWWFWLTIIIVIIAMTIIFFISNQNGVGKAGISKAEFEKIEVGKTTNFQINKIIDQNNEWSDDEIYNKCVEKIKESKENSKYTYVYKYRGENGGYAIITLQADYSNGYFYNDVIVINKEQFGLK